MPARYKDLVLELSRASSALQPDSGRRRHLLNTVTDKSRKHFNIDASRYDEMQAGSIALTKVPDMDAESAVPPR